MSSSCRSDESVDKFIFDHKVLNYNHFPNKLLAYKLVRASTSWIERSSRHSLTPLIVIAIYMYMVTNIVFKYNFYGKGI